MITVLTQAFLKGLYRGLEKRIFSFSKSLEQKHSTVCSAWRRVQSFKLSSLSLLIGQSILLAVVVKTIDVHPESGVNASNLMTQAWCARFWEVAD